MAVSRQLVSQVTLIDLVNTSEGDLGELLQGHHVDGGGDGLLPSALSALAEVLQGLVLSEPHLDLNPVVSKVNLLLPLAQSDLTVVTLKRSFSSILSRFNVRQLLPCLPSCD